MYRTTKETSEVPFIFISSDDATVVIQTRRGSAIFRFTCVEPSTQLLERDKTYSNKPTISPYKTNENQHSTHTLAHALVTTYERNSVRKSILSANVNNSIEFATSRKADLDGLLRTGPFLPVHRYQVPADTSIFASHFIDKLKKSKSGTQRKSRLVAQNYGDDRARQVVTKAPTVQRFLKGIYSV